ncbi:MAG: hypothetical protein ACYC4U_10290 [Pirellulaceae bacterium]
MKLQRKAPKVEVFIDDELQADFNCMSATQSLGSGRSDVAVIVQERPGESRHRLRLEEIALGEALINLPCEVVVTSEEGGERVLHFGKIVAVNADLGPQGELLTFTSRLDDHLLGPICERTEVYLDDTLTSVAGGEPRIFRQGEILFNPIDKHGELLPTMWFPGEAAYPQMIDPRAFSRDKKSWAKGCWNWTLPEAVLYLCRCWNVYEWYVDNPTLSDLEALFLDPVTGDEGLILRNVIVPQDTTLPHALTRLLEPFGWSWYVDLLERGKRRIWFRDRRQTTPHELNLQRYGEALDLDKSDVSEYKLQYDTVNRSCTHVKVAMDLPRVEGTFILVPAWDPVYDRATVASLVPTTEEFEDDEPEKKRAWRDFVLNESGEYYPRLSTRGHARPLAYFEDLKTLFTDCDARIAQPNLRKIRRRFYPMLTRDADGSGKKSELPAYVEYTTNLGAKEPTWKPLMELLSDGFSVQLLDDECGIRLNAGQKPHEKIISQRATEGWINSFALRVTTCIEGDEPVVVSAGNDPDTGQAFLSDELFISVDASEKYRCSFTHPKSRFAIAITSGALQTNAAFDIDEATKFATYLHKSWGNASCTGQLTLPLLDILPFDLLGKPVTIAGDRNVSLRTTHKNWGYQAFPLVVEISYDIQQQTTRLTLDSYRLPN